MTSPREEITVRLSCGHPLRVPDGEFCFGDGAYCCDCDERAVFFAPDHLTTVLSKVAPEGLDALTEKSWKLAKAIVTCGTCGDVLYQPVIHERCGHVCCRFCFRDKCAECGLMRTAVRPLPDLERLIQESLFGHDTRGLEYSDKFTAELMGPQGKEVILLYDGALGNVFVDLVTGISAVIADRAEKPIDLVDIVLNPDWSPVPCTIPYRLFRLLVKANAEMGVHDWSDLVTLGAWNILVEYGAVPGLDRSRLLEFLRYLVIPGFDGAETFPALTETFLSILAECTWVGDSRCGYRDACSR
ncbi:ORF12 [Ictalurid herpesvirus 1]|uniref:Putative zinc-binding protein ORF12 n=1 Tax=Ictalurid herpesvirus 1 (strain Auburn) TaxID=766178 RepID=VG12_ICHVA|nr:ORF12 [Ictalurid herpesvirus 1]NP_041181.1 ORF12 [Ictalurid herpesvirus 1]Q00165.1 RecName: Full=Putative zinc-binding protein ORF12 [Ictalurid herpesvirus 1 (strain Auburn)]AAA88115.1 ORF12 [Ictalurid herpesvirus 1]AAA88193.1 ORF12 [Ictalurid herpesvirus 1]